MNIRNPMGFLNFFSIKEKNALKAFLFSCDEFSDIKLV